MCILWEMIINSLKITCAQNIFILLILIKIKQEEFIAGISYPSFCLEYCIGILNEKELEVANCKVHVDQMEIWLW